MPVATTSSTAQGTDPQALPAEVRIAIVGSGFSGLGMAHGLLEDGERDFVILERASDLGGTWRDNVYPGCACDVPSLMYSFSWAQNPDWSRMFSPQQEIWEYQKDVSDRFGITPHIRYGAELENAEWLEDEQRWHLTTPRGELRAQFLVAGTGPLCEPKYPEVPGLETFEGTKFHSARWDHSHDLTGKRVAVIGTGASAIQFVPRIQPKVQSLTLFQRTPPWVMPKPDRAIGRLEHAIYRHVPGAQKLVRGAIYGFLETYVLAYNHIRPLGNIYKRIALRHLEKQVPDPVLRAKLTPDYDYGCKRQLISNDYFPALSAPNADVNVDGIVEVRANSVIDGKGVEHEVDTIIYGTGFHVTDQPIAEVLQGRDGRRLSDEWAQGMEAYRGSTASGFPNFFLLVGPNTGLGHNSIIYMIESQVTYVCDALRIARRQRIGALEPRPEIVQAENDEIQKRLEGTVWTDGGCASWYLDPSGRNTTLWPDFTFLFRGRTKRFVTGDYVLTPETTAPAGSDAEREPVPA